MPATAWHRVATPPDRPQGTAHYRRGMRILLACDKFKGTLTSPEVHARLAPALSAAGHTVDSVPIADGGDGTVDAAVYAGFTRHTAEVTGPLGTTVTAVWAESSGTAVIEMAQASGLALVSADSGSDPGADTALTATSAGTGELIATALDAGCTEIVLGVGGSATTDGGAGMLTALGVRLLDEAGDPIPPGGVGLERLARVDTTGLHPGLREGTAHVILASDVENPLIGPRGAAAVYGPQKGAGPAEVVRLDRALERFAALVPDGAHHAARTGSGAAGGMGFGAFALLGAASVPGADYVLDLVGFGRALGTAEVVVTGEGRFDEQTLSGKGPGAVIAAARDAGLPAHVVCGSSEIPADQASALGLAGIHSLTDLAPIADCLADPGPLLERLAAELLAPALEAPAG